MISKYGILYTILFSLSLNAKDVTFVDSHDQVICKMPFTKYTAPLLNLKESQKSIKTIGSISKSNGDIKINISYAVEPSALKLLCDIAQELNGQITLQKQKLLPKEDHILRSSKGKVGIKKDKFQEIIDTKINDLTNLQLAELIKAVNFFKSELLQKAIRNFIVRKKSRHIDNNKITGELEDLEKKLQ